MDRDPYGGERVPRVTPMSHPDHAVVGHEFLGSCWPRRSVMRWFCASHDAEGYWLFATDGSGEWHNVSERAIGASFHFIYDVDGRKLCSFARVPNYDHMTLYNDRWLGR